MIKTEWILCPVCGSKTRDRLREDTVLSNSTKEIAPLVGLTTGAIYARLDHLQKKLKQFKE